MAVCQNLVPLVNIKIAGKWMFIPLKMVLIGIDPNGHLEGIAHRHQGPGLNPLTLEPSGPSSIFPSAPPKRTIFPWRIGV